MLTDLFKTSTSLCSFLRDTKSLLDRKRLSQCQYDSFQLLNLLGERLFHVVPNSELHQMKTVGDLIDFYGRPFRNITAYAQMARDDKQTLPKNLHIMEHPFRFHPEDTHAYHGGE